MPSCNPFSGLKGKFSKKKRAQDAANVPTGSENVNIAPPDTVPSGQSGGTSPPAKEKVTSLEGPVRESSGQQDPPIKDRWRDAFDQLSPAKQSILKEMGFDNLKSGSMKSNIDDLIGEVNRKQEECEKKFWHVNVGGEKVVLREYTTQIVGWLQKAGDIAVQFAPPQVSLPWGLVRSMMNIPVNESEQMGALLATTEKVVRITGRGQVYENVYLPQAPDAQLSSVQSNLDSALVNIYGTALDLLAESGKLLSASTARRMLEAIVNPGKATDNFSGLAEQEDEILRDVQACESQRSSDSDKRAHEMLDALQAPMARVDEGVSHLLNHVSESERIQLLEWISPIPFGKYHDAVSETRTPNTGEWLLKHKDFRDWETRRSSALFWLQGNPGSGKTYLTSTVIDEVRAQTSKCQMDGKHRNAEGFAFFYCKRDDKPRDQPLAILQSFVRQLSTTAGNPESMQVKLQESCKKARESGTDFRFEKCKEQILASLNAYQRTTLVIDAMDECDPDASDSRYELIEALKLFLSESKRVVRIFISSRPDPNIQSQLESSPNIGIQADDNQDDIKKFLHTELDKLEKINTSLKRLKTQIIAKLLERCQGMFQWAEMQIHQIAKCKSPPDIWKRLENLPEDLQKTYDEVWRQIEGQEKYDQIFIKRALRWVMSASEPMTSVELLAAIRMGPDGDILPFLDTVDEQGLLSLCNNFLVVDPKLKVWRFPHLSVREYLEAKDGWSAPHAHHHAATVCLSYFVDRYEQDDSEFDDNLAAEFQIDITKPEDIGEPEKPAQSDEGFHTLHPFHIYMRHTWAHHVNGARDIETTKLAPLLKTFLGSPNESSTQYRRWHQKTGNDFGSSSKDRHLKHYAAGFAGSTFRDISPGDAAIFSMCRFSLAAIVWDWWENEEIDISRVNGDKKTLLEIAVIAGCLPICNKLVQKLNDKGADADAQRAFFGNSLLHASLRGNEEIIRMLLDRGADVNMQAGRYGTPLIAASMNGNEKAVQLLLNRGAAVNAEGGMEGTALIAASMYGKAKAVQVLLDGGANADVSSEQFGTAIRAAACEGHAKIVQILLDGGAKIDAPSEFGTALQVASFNGDEKMVQMLLNRGADPNAEGEYAFGVPWGTALEAASSHGTERTVQMLLDRGADVNASNAQGDSATALQAALIRGIPSIVQILLDHRADVNQKGEDGDLPLIAAAAGWNPEMMVQMLLDHGADVNAQGPNGTPLQFASSRGNENIVQMLLKHDAKANIEDK